MKQQLTTAQSSSSGSNTETEKTGKEKGNKRNIYTKMVFVERHRGPTIFIGSKT